MGGAPKQLIFPLGGDGRQARGGAVPPTFALSATAHPSSVFVLLLPPSLRQELKRWVAAAKDIFICWETV